MTATTITSRAAAALVAGVAGFASYRHIYDVAVHAGEHHGVALVLPLSIDGLIVVGTMAMLDDKRANRRARPAARFALAFGIVATIAANIASAQPDVLSRAVAAVPALAFLIAVEVLVHTGRPVRVVAEPVQLVHEPEPADPWEHSIPVQSAPEPETTRPVQTAPVRKTVQRTRTTRTAPAGAHPVPPRVLDMARALNDKYPGPIPGRRTVMPAMGWSSVGDAQAAINHLKAERAKGAPPVHLVPDSPAELDRVAV